MVRDQLDINSSVNNQAEVLLLDNGLELIVKEMPDVESVSVGVFTKVSGYQEPESLRGIAHFLEHMLFKGTARRKSKQITQEIDALGGSINAHTSREYTGYSALLLAENYYKGLDVLLDLFFCANLTEADCELEKKVISEEINMYEDTPDDIVHDLFVQALWDKHALGQPILGTKESIHNITSAQLKTFYKQYFSRENTCLVLVGKLGKIKPLMRWLNQWMKRFVSLEATIGQGQGTCLKPKNWSRFCFSQKDVEQFHLCLGVPALSCFDKDRYALSLLSTILGGSMSSRLFQQIREKHGWAYSVYSYAAYYQPAGFFSIYAGIGPQYLKKSLKVLARECDKLCQKQVYKHELSRCKAQFKGHLILGLERPSSWMYFIARRYMQSKKLPHIGDIQRKIDAIEPLTIQKVAQSLLLKDKMSLAIIGPKSKDIKQEDHLKSLVETHLV